jgi:MazG family protein
MGKIGDSFERLVEILAKLRAPDGCPWDREQHYKDIAPHTLEETYEVIEAIEREDYDSLREELGDFIMQALFYAQIATEEKRFTIQDVIEKITEKLIHRHPHVFGETKADNSRQVLKNWEQLKKKEGKSVLGGVPKNLPALLKAYRIGEKAGRVGFDWENVDGILDKVEEEANELAKARREKDEHAVEHEFGDLLFTLANIGRFLGINPESALRGATERFIERFHLMEREIEARNKTMRELSPEEWDELWERAKKEITP